MNDAFWVFSLKKEEGLKKKKKMKKDCFASRIWKEIFRNKVISVMHYASKVRGIQKSVKFEKIQPEYYKRWLRVNRNMNSLVVWLVKLMKKDCFASRIRKEIFRNKVISMMHYASKVRESKKVTSSIRYKRNIIRDG